MKDYGYCILYNPSTILWHYLIIKVLPTCMGYMNSVDVGTPKVGRQQSIIRASTEPQQSLNDFGCWIWSNRRAVLQYLPIIEALAASIGNTISIDVATPTNECHRSVNWVSTILGVASCIIEAQCYGFYP